MTVDGGQISVRRPKRERPSRSGGWVLSLGLAVVGAIVGSAIDPGLGTLIGAAVGYLLGREIANQSRIRRIEQVNAAQSVAPPSGQPMFPPPLTPPSQIPPPPGAPPSQFPPPATPLSEIPPPPGAPLSQIPPPPGAPPSQTPPPPPRPLTGSGKGFATSAPANDFSIRLKTALKRWVATSNLPVKAGIVVTLVGLGLLLGEANRRGIVTITARLVLIAVGLVGVALLVLGWRFARRQPIYGLSLQGGGLATLYLVTFVAYAGYDLLAAVPALGCVVAITVTAGVLALVNDSRSLAALGLAGGLLAPVLTHSGVDDQLSLFSFYVVLNVAIIWISRQRRWQELYLLGFGFTFGVSSFWLLHRHVEEDWSVTQPFIALFIVTYSMIPAIQPPGIDQGQDTKIRALWWLPLVFGTALAGILLQGGLVGHLEYGMTVSALGLSALYGALAAYVQRTRPATRELLLSYVALSVVFLVLAVPLSFGTPYGAVIGTAQGTLLVWAGSRYRQEAVMAIGVFLQVLAGIVFASDLTIYVPGLQDEVPVANGFFLRAAVVAVAGLLSGWFAFRASRSRDLSVAISWIALAWGSGWLLAAGLLEIGAHVTTVQLSASSGFVIAYFLLAAWAARRLQWPDLGVAGLLVLPTMAVSLVVALSVQAHPFEDYGWAVWLLAFGAHFAVLRWRTHLPSELLDGLHAGGLWVLVLLVCTEVRWQVERIGDGVWPTAAALLAGVLIVGSILAGRWEGTWPIGAFRSAYVLPGCGVVLGGLSWLGAVMLLSFDGDAPPLRYVPVLNPLEVSGLALAAVVALWGRQAKLVGGQDLKRSLGVIWAPALGAFGTVFVSMALVRTVHHWGGVSFDTVSMFDSTALQASLSVAWAVLGLSAMVSGVRRISRPLWMVGAAYMAVVLLKLFLFDLGNQPTEGRLISFLSVGLLLLVVGYFAPFPPAAQEQPDQLEATGV